MKRILFLLLGLFSSCTVLVSAEDETDSHFWEHPVPEKKGIDERLPLAWEELQTSEQVLEFVVDLRRGKIRKTWIVSISDDDVDKGPEEGEESSLVYYASTGDSFEFTTRLKYLKLSTLGPLIQKKDKYSKKSKLNTVVHASVRAPEDYLSLGFQDMAEFSLFMQTRERPESGFNVNTTPFPEDVVSRSKREFEELGITPEQIRSMIGLAPSMNSFFNLLINAPGVSDIIKDVIKKPSLFSLMRNGINIKFGLKGQGVRMYNPTHWGLAENDTCYTLPVELALNEKIALEALLIVSKPEGPLRYCAGVVGMVAYTPGRYDQFLLIYPRTTFLD